MRRQVGRRGPRVHRARGPGVREVLVHLVHALQRVVLRVRLGRRVGPVGAVLRRVGPQRVPRPAVFVLRVLYFGVVSRGFVAGGRRPGRG